MKKTTLVLCIFAAAWNYALGASGQKVLKTTFSERTSPHATYSALIGPHDFKRIGTRVTLVYGRPYSKDPQTGEKRKIWGKLVPYGQAWRMGADEPTWFIVDRAIVTGGKTISAGAYTLYFIPKETEPSQLAFSSKLGGWGIPVDETRDVARVDARKESIENIVDQFTLTIEDDPVSDGPALCLTWENTRYVIPFAVKN